MPFSWYGPLPDACIVQSVNRHQVVPHAITNGRTSIEPAISMCAHRMDGSSAPSASSTPSTKDLRKSAAVQHPARLPPVYLTHTPSVFQQVNEVVEMRTYVAQVSVGRVDLWAVLFVKGHAPEAVVLAEPGSMEFVPERVRVLR